MLKSEYCQLNKEMTSLTFMLKEVERFTNMLKISKKDALRIRLLAEELKGILPGIVENFDGFFWLECEDNNFEIHVEFDVAEMSFEKRNKLVAFSSSGKNEATKGIMGKIRAVAETMMLAISEPATSLGVPYYGAEHMTLGFIYVDPASVVENSYMYSWSLNNYKSDVYKEEIKEASDELEYSIVANLADDILVGVKGKFVEITIKKTI
jgi:hypothetical protein